MAYLSVRTNRPFNGCHLLFVHIGIAALELPEICAYNMMAYLSTMSREQCGILTSVDSSKSAQPPFKLRNS